jgi:multiple sugar transport system permease protein
MLRSKRTEILAASLLMAPFVVTYGVLFIYPTIKMAQLSLTNAPLIGPGKWVGLDYYFRLASDCLFSVAIWNTLYFVVLSVIPSTLIGLVVALGVNRLMGWLQSVVLAAFFLPYVLPVSVVFTIWQWMCDKDENDPSGRVSAPLRGGGALVQGLGLTPRPVSPKLGAGDQGAARGDIGRPR